MLQAEAAAEIGVTESTIWNWEHGTEPKLIHIPAVLSFLGYVPWECPDDPVGRLAYLRRSRACRYGGSGRLWGVIQNN